ncbi:type 4a pilus biogenesis protein PilO [Candidatus Parcubacteria bacterium]|nr:type 4a pilus biogenesis protein PilO [Candidatus Parcubacteria bacterium]
MNPSRNYIGAVLIAAAGIIFWVFAMPAYDDIKSLKAANEERATILQNRTAIIDNISKLTQQYQERASDIQKLSYVIPSSKSPAELVSAIQDIAVKNGLQLTSLVLADQKTDEQAAYSTQPVDMGLVGSYPAFKSFLESLEKNIRLLDVISLDANPTGDSISLIGFRIKANAYFLHN